MNRVWSEKQTAVFSWFAAITLNVVAHLVVRARAGTGKTTTIVEAVRRIPKGLSILVCAFGKDIQLELEKRLAGSGATAKTLHAIGLSFVKSFWPDVRVNYSNERETALAERVCGAAAPDAIKKLVATLCTKGRLIAPFAKTLGDLTEIAYEFECEPDEKWHDCSCGFPRWNHEGDHEYAGFDLDYVETKALAAMELAAAEKPVKTGIDGADMLYLPVRNGWLRKKFDVVIVDEAQDMNACQLEIALGVAKSNIVVVGDDRQAIYRFAGADSGSLDRMKDALKATELPLNVTYRCGKNIVALAQRYVPDFVAAESNHDGSVEYLPQDKLIAAAQPGDYILSRVNAPLVSVAMSLLRNGKRTKIAGRSIGEGLVNLVRKLKGQSIPDLLRKISAWETKEINRIEQRYRGKLDSSACVARIEGVRDQAEMLASLTDGAPNVAEVEARIVELFTDNGLGEAGLVTCSSVHRAKGKEANRVFVLQNTLRQDTPEECNIIYVAYTRAKQTLVLVGEERRKDY